MQDAVPKGQGAMAAIMGGDDGAVMSACAEAAQGQCVEAVNFNAPGQLVIAGHKEAVERAIGLAKQKGAKRGVMLPVSAPFHSTLLRPGGSSSRAARRSAHPHAEDSGHPQRRRRRAREPDEIREALARQAANPVHWTATVAPSPTGRHPRRRVRSGQGAGGPTKRIVDRLPAYALTDSDAIAAARAELCAAHSATTERCDEPGSPLAGQIALVTGATRGIGRAIALRLAHDGATVIGTATTDEGAATISATLGEAGNAGTGMRLDVTDAAQTDAVIAAIESKFGAITILVNNAGVTRDNLLLRMKDDEWDAIMATNLKPAYRLAKAVMRGMMKARHGRIIQIGSVVGSSGNAGQANYAAAKAALLGFTKSLAQEVGSRNITVNCVAPGFIDTDMTKALPDAARETLLSRIPLGRLGHARGHRARRAYLARPRRGLRDGRHAARQWRHVHGRRLIVADAAPADSEQSAALFW